MRTDTIRNLFSRTRPDLETGCWVWSSYRLKDGYGRFWIDGNHQLAHRASYRLFTGPIPDGQVVRHKCDNPPCVNPGHLEVGTIADNIRDRGLRGRTYRMNWTECPRGHDLAEPNLLASRTGRRRCRACDLARRAVRKNPKLDLVETADRYYQSGRSAVLVPGSDSGYDQSPTTI